MPEPPASDSRFGRLAETGRAAWPLRLDGRSAEAQEDDTLLVALRQNGRRLRDSEFGDGMCILGDEATGHYTWPRSLRWSTWTCPRCVRTPCGAGLAD